MNLEMSTWPKSPIWWPTLRVSVAAMGVAKYKDYFGKAIRKPLGE